MENWWDDPSWEAFVESDARGEDLLEDEHRPSQLTASRTLLEFLIWLRLSGELTAKTICILAFWAQHAGAIGLESLAKQERQSKKLLLLINKNFYF